MVIKKGQYLGSKRKNSYYRQKVYDLYYLPNKKKYTLPFKKYVIHQTDFDKGNKRLYNLELITPEAHAKIHKPELIDLCGCCEHNRDSIWSWSPSSKIGQFFETIIGGAIFLLLIPIILLVFGCISIGKKIGIATRRGSDF